MGFVLTQTRSYIWPVEVNLPTDGGRFEKSTFEAEFKRLPQSEVEAMVNQIMEGETIDRRVATDVVVGWRGVTETQGGAEVPFSPTNLDALLEIPTVATSIIKAWMESLTGAKRKN